MAADAGTPGWGPVLGVGGFQLAGMWVPTTQWGQHCILAIGEGLRTGKSCRRSAVNLLVLHLCPGDSWL